jgi:O-antigen ligase
MMLPKRQMVSVVQTSAPPYLILTASAWCMATRGGTDLRDLAIVGVLLAVAFVSAAATSDVPLRTPPAAGAALLLALLAWLILDGPVRSGLGLETVRVPSLVVLGVLTIRTVGLLDETQRERILQGLIVVGTVHGALAIALSLETCSSGECVAGFARAESLLGNPNALGVVLVATATLTLREARRHLTPLVATALAVQSIAVLLTGSRMAILAALFLICWYWMTEATWTARAILSSWVLTGALVLAFRFAHSLPNRRFHLWTAAIERIALQPITGYGPASEIYDVPLTDNTRPTTHAHNELLQWTVDYGLIGLLLLLGTLILALKSVYGHWSGDGWLVAATAILLASGLTDFSLRITAITIITAALAAAVFVPPRQPSTAATSGAALKQNDP